VSIRALVVRRSYDIDLQEVFDMQYMLLIYDEEDAATRSMTEEERNAFMGEYFAYTESLRAAGKFVAGDALQGISTATSVRVRNGDRLVTDGPFAETKEQLGGYYLIEAESLDEALDWAARIPSARLGTIEVRPLVVWG
jgi:hypothetical protein